jgi:hypothetical protein
VITTIRPLPKPLRWASTPGVAAARPRPPAAPGRRPSVCGLDAGHDQLRLRGDRGGRHRDDLDAGGSEVLVGRHGRLPVEHAAVEPAGVDHHRKGHVVTPEVGRGETSTMGVVHCRVGPRRRRETAADDETQQVGLGNRPCPDGRLGDGVAQDPTAVVAPCLDPMGNVVEPDQPLLDRVDDERACGGWVWAARRGVHERASLAGETQRAARDDPLIQEVAAGDPDPGDGPSGAMGRHQHMDRRHDRTARQPVHGGRRHTAQPRVGSREEQCGHEPLLR